MQTDYDVIIVGGGLAGGCLALALADSGLKIALIESNTRQERFQSEAGDRALALAAGTVETLEKLNIWQGVQASATPIKHIHVSDQGHFGKTRLSAAKEGVAALGYVITARVIEDHVAALLEQTTLHLLCPARVIGISNAEHEASVSIKQAGTSDILTARLVVGADGGQSSVRKLLDISQQTTDYGQTAIVTTVKSSHAHQNTAYERFTPFGPLALLPTVQGQSSVVWTRNHEQAQDLMGLSEPDFTAQLQACFGYRLGELQLTAQRRAFPLSLIRAQQMHSGRSVIIGNAVHQLHPVAGQGFNLGLRDVLDLAERLVQQQQKSLDIGERGFLHAFEQNRLQDHNRVIGFTDSLIKMFSNQSLVLAAMRSAGLTLLDHLPPAKHYLSQHAMGLRY